MLIDAGFSISLLCQKEHRFLAAVEVGSRIGGVLMKRIMLREPGRDCCSGTFRVTGICGESLPVSCFGDLSQG